MIAPGPIVTLLASLREEAAAFRRRCPNGTVGEVLSSVCDDLATAIDEARRVELYLTVDELSEQIGRPRSTITRICRLHGSRAGATKVEGAWLVHWPTFDAYLTKRVPPNQLEAA